MLRTIFNNKKPLRGHNRKVLKMTYSESAQGLTITKERALLELKKHCIDDIQCFLDECGDCATYDASEVLAWLGY